MPEQPEPVPGHPAPSITRWECPVHGWRGWRRDGACDVCGRSPVQRTYVPLAALEAMTAERDAAEAKLDALRATLTSDDVVRAMCARVREELRGKRWMSDAMLTALMKSVAEAALSAALGTEEKEPGAL